MEIEFSKSTKLSNVEEYIKNLDRRRNWPAISRSLYLASEYQLYKQDKHNLAQAWIHAKFKEPTALQKSRSVYERLVVRSGVSVQNLEGIPKANIETVKSQWDKIPPEYHGRVLDSLRRMSWAQAGLFARDLKSGQLSYKDVDPYVTPKERRNPLPSDLLGDGFKLRRANWRLENEPEAIDYVAWNKDKTVMLVVEDKRVAVESRHVGQALGYQNHIREVRKKWRRLRYLPGPNATKYVELNLEKVEEIRAVIIGHQFNL